MSNKINSIFEEVLERVRPPAGDLDKINISINDLKKIISGNLKKNHIKAEIFIGGSFAKNTLIKKDSYDIDIFVRFDNKENGDISDLTERLLSGLKFDRIHGSRDYFRIKSGDNLILEVVPVKKVKNPKNAENITDLSYFHVRYAKNKIKDKKIINDIRIAKAFCHSNNTYGAESYIQGFSGYSLELLIHYYKGFLKFIKAVSKMNANKKAIIDIEKHYRSKSQIMLDINSSKLNSPIILIDPTFRQRNASAALSQETFLRFQKSVKEFLKSPSIKAFEKEKTDLASIKKDSRRKNNEFILIEADTDRQEGDIAGSKLLKFYRHLGDEISVLFSIKKRGFNYNREKTARYFFVAKSKGEIILNGPSLKDEKNLLKFRKKHRNVFTRNKRIYAREKVSFSIKGFVEDWKKKNAGKMREMGITKLNIVN